MYGRKGGQKGGKEELLSRISRTHCKLCGVMGHWKAECPQRREQAREQANVVQDGLHEKDLSQVIIEEINEAWCRTCHIGECFYVQNLQKHPLGIPESIRARAIQFLSRRLSTHWSNGQPKGIVKRNNVDKRGKGEIMSGVPREMPTGSLAHRSWCPPAPMMPPALQAK